MNFEDQVQRLFDDPPHVDPVSHVEPFSKTYNEGLGDIVRGIEGVLKQLAKFLPDSEFTPADRDPEDATFYVTALRIPSIPAKGFRFPVRLYFVVFPTYSPGFLLRIARVVAVGSGTHFLSVRGFLRAWNDAGTGGVVIYEGDINVESAVVACEQAALRFLQRRHEISDWYEGDKSDAGILVWPIDPSFQPRLCPRCLLPVIVGSKCAKCGSYAARRSK